MSILESRFFYEFLGAVSAVGVIAILVWGKQRYLYNGLRSLPSPQGGNWLFGNGPQILAAVKAKKYFKLLFDWAKELGPIYVYWVGNRPVVILSDPKLIENTIINGMKNGSLIRTERSSKAWNDISGPILLGTSGTEWQWRRKAWNLEFTPNAVAKYLPIIDRACDRIIEKIKAAPSGSPVKADPLFVELTMRIISCLLLGVPVEKNSSSHEGPPLDVPRVYQAMSVLGYRFLKVAIGEKMWLKYLPTKSAREYWEARKYIEEFLTPRIDLALQMRDNSDRDWSEVSPLFRESMLVKIAAKEPKYDRAGLIAESIELLIAGTDTTAHSLSFALSELSLNPKVAEKARNIVDRTWEKYGGITSESFKELSYIGAIFKETLRLYPVANGSTSLEAKQNTPIEDIFVAPRGTSIYWSVLAAGRDERYYHNPEELIPDRWLRTEESQTLPLTIGFGSGLHRCLGEHLSLLEGTMMLAMLLRYFDWELVNSGSSLENLQHNLLVFPVDGMPVKFKQRELFAPNRVS
ncbi:MAG: cytochrome P450 [Prochloraceae cyanobacterium]|nr:cytochrome P450 [Prochloraceae cyanobacterium]